MRTPVVSLAGDRQQPAPVPDGGRHHPVLHPALYHRPRALPQVLNSQSAVFQKPRQINSRLQKVKTAKQSSSKSQGSQAIVFQKPR